MTHTNEAPERIWLFPDLKNNGEDKFVTYKDPYEFEPKVAGYIPYIRADLAVSETPSDDHQSGLVSADEAQKLDLNLADWIERRKESVGPYADYIIKSVREYEHALHAYRVLPYCYGRKPNYRVHVTRTDFPKVHCCLEDALTIRSVDDVRREALEEAARYIEKDLPNWRDDIQWAVEITANEIRQLADN